MLARDQARREGRERPAQVPEAATRLRNGVTGPTARPRRIVRVIARLNVGGPAHHVTILSDRLRAHGYETLLVAGRVGAHEGSLAHLAHDRDVALVEIPDLGPEVRPLADLRALIALTRLLWREQPDLLHTHTAKAGALGRLAALLARPRARPIVVHTYHGHVLSRYFGVPARTAFRVIEWTLARFTDRLVGVSQATVDDLVALRVARRERFSVVPVGLELDAFLAVDGEPEGTLRDDLGGGDDPLFVYVGRLAPIKRVDLLIQAMSRLKAQDVSVRLAVVGDGESRTEIEGLIRTLGVEDRVAVLGFRDRVEEVYAAADAAVLCSDDEGTPVSLIEAAAAGRPCVATDVGGVSDVVTPSTGILVPPNDPEALAHAMRRLAEAPELRHEMGIAGRAHVSTRFTADRLVEDISRLYDTLLAPRVPEAER